MDGIWTGAIIGGILWIAAVILLGLVGVAFKWKEKTVELLGVTAFLIVPIMMAKFAWEELKELPLPF